MSRRAAALVLATLLSGCGGRGGLPPNPPPVVKGPDGKDYHVVDRGPYRAFYDAWGRLERIEYDSNGDGRPDQVSHHDGGAKSASRIDLDEDFDGRADRWEYYDPAGKLIKEGTSRRGKGMPDVWTLPAPGGLPARQEFDDDADGRVDRIDAFQGGRLVRVEIDSDRDGRMDRWQGWSTGRLVSEDLDTDGDGKPDRRIRYGAQGRILALEPLHPQPSS